MMAGIPINQIKSANNYHFDEKNLSHQSAKSHHLTLLKLAAIICFIIYLLCATIVCGILVWLSVLPLKYLLVLLVTSIVITTIIGFLVFKKFTKKSANRIAKTTAITLEAIFSILFIIVFLYLNHTMGFMDAIRASEFQTDNYYLVVKNDSPYTTLADLHYHTVATYDENDDKYQSALSQLDAKVVLKPTDYGSVTNAASALINNLADSLFIKSSLTDVLSEIIPDFNMADLRIIETVEIKTKIISTASDNINVAKDSFNIFVSGIDTYGEISTVSRSDVNMIITVNPRTHTVLLTSIPRDYYVQLHGTTGLKDKLTHAGLYGINMSINTLEDLFSINIDYYIRVNFDSTINLIDAIDGINITPDITFSRWTDGVYCYYEEGVINHLDGFCALRYARERKAYGTGDMHRTQNQQEVIMAVINKLTSSKILLAKYTDILSSMNGTIETNIPPSQIYKLVNEQLDSMPSWTIERISLEGTHIDAPTYTISDQYLYVFEPIPESVSAATAKIQEIMSAN